MYSSGYHKSPIVVLQAVLVAFRGLGVRPEVNDEARASHRTAQSLTSLISRNADLGSGRYGSVSLSGIRDESRMQGRLRISTGSQQAENRIQQLLDRTSLFAKRQKVRARFGCGSIDWRNRLLRIDSSSARPVSASAYQASLQLIELSLRYARSKGVHVIVYLSPIRPIEPNPNVPSDVKRFRTDLPVYQAVRCDMSRFFDLIPERLWTNYPQGSRWDKANSPDFAHFTGAAHKLVAETLMADVGSQLWRGLSRMAWRQR